MTDPLCLKNDFNGLLRLIFRKIECAVLEKSTKNYENLTLGFEDRGQKGLIWAIWGSKGGFSDIKTPTGGRIRIFRGYRQLNSRFKH